MNNIDFRIKMHEYIDELYDNFQNYQRDVMGALNEFDRICKKYNIIYYIGFGALLGIYRDNCILPWDYDIDVLVPIYERNRLIDAIKKELDEDYYYYCPENDKKCRHFCMRITKKKYDSSVIHLDVFYLIGAPEDLRKQKIFKKVVKWINFTRKIKLVDAKKETMGIKVFYYAEILKKIIYIWCPIFLLNKIEKILCNKYDINNSKYLMVMQAAADTYTSDIFKNPTEIIIGGNKYCAPTNIIKFFDQTYKDYKSYPPVQSCFDEFYNTSKKIIYFNNSNRLYNKIDFQINKY